MDNWLQSRGQHPPAQCLGRLAKPYGENHEKTMGYAKDHGEILEILQIYMIYGYYI